VAKARRPRIDPLLAALGVAAVSARERAGLSQEQAGFRCDLDRTYISGIERGVRNPTVKSLRRLAEALKTKASTLLREAEERSERS
jgi:transcriptional regulator with XRE-family HTH domain